MNFFTTEKLLEYLSAEGLDRAIKIANVQDILMSLESSNIENICDYFINSIFLRDTELIPRIVDNIFICCKYREFYVSQYAFLIYSLHQIIQNATKILNSVNLGFQTKEQIDKNIFTFNYLTKTEQIFNSYSKKDFQFKEKVTRRRKSLILNDNQDKIENNQELNPDENQIKSVIDMNSNKEKLNETETIESTTKITPGNDSEFDVFFNEFIMKSDLILELFRDRVFQINQSVARQPWRFCIYRCIEIFNTSKDYFYRYIQ